ncbi:MAG: hypothetical protein GX327_01415 [Epulopiscium sp.]|nr:hypothetical protein [Candidatus Epulonipiscium sp.]
MRDIGAFFYYVKKVVNKFVNYEKSGVEVAFVLDFLPGFIFSFLDISNKAIRRINYSLYCFF